jgi:THO complex subunit 2
VDYAICDRHCSPAFYITFWQLSIYDLAPPIGRYQEEVLALAALSSQEDKEANMAERSADRSKRNTATVHRARRDRYNATVKDLHKELREQTIARESTKKRLNREKMYWFKDSK